MKAIFALLLVIILPLRLGAARHGATVLGILKAANMNSTSDQAIAIDCTRYVIRRVIGLNTSTSLTLAVGGIYTTTSKGGNAVVAATQVWSALTSSSKFVDATLAAIATTDVRTEACLYLSLTTAQGGAATMDLYVLGDAVD